MLQQHVLLIYFVFMTNSEWRSALVSRFAGQVRLHRSRRGMTQEDLANACEERGVTVSKGTLANLETGRRDSLEVIELMVLADVLGVPPVSLLFPMGGDETAVERLPGASVHPWEAAAWFLGESPTLSPPAAGSPRAQLDAYRAHALAVQNAQVSARHAAERRQQATATADPEFRAQFLGATEAFEKLHQEDLQRLQTVRNALRTQGLVPPPLPEELTQLDSTDGEAKA